MSVPLIAATNRINDPQVAGRSDARGDADMVSMARVALSRYRLAVRTRR